MLDGGRLVPFQQQAVPAGSSAPAVMAAGRGPYGDPLGHGGDGVEDVLRANLAMRRNRLETAALESWS